MRHGIPNVLKQFAKKLLFPIPKRLKVKHISINNKNINIIKKSIKDNYSIGWREKMYEDDLKVHLFQRLLMDRRTVSTLDR